MTTTVHAEKTAGATPTSDDQGDRLYRYSPLAAAVAGRVQALQAASLKD